MSKISALMMGQNKEIAKVLIKKKQNTDKRCSICGKPINYSINNSDTCMECYSPE